jgi:hypothetical protein
MFRQLVALLALDLVAAPLAAQQSTQTISLRRGSEVRVYTRGAYAAGRLVDLSPLAIVVAGRKGSSQRFTRSEVMQVQIRDGRRWTDIAPEQLPATHEPPEGPAASDGRVAAPGVRVRVTQGGRRIVGRLAQWRGDTVVLARSAAKRDTVTLGPDTQIEISAGRQSAALAGFLAGAVIGGAAGAAGASAFCEGLDFGFGGGDCDGSAATGGALGAFVVGGVGAAVGSAIHTERWVEVPADSVRAFVAEIGRPGGR